MNQKIILLLNILLVTSLYQAVAIPFPVGFYPYERNEKTFFNGVSSYSFNTINYSNDYQFTSELSYYSSYNNHNPHGMNDGALWQGKGYNGRIIGGFIYKSGAWIISINPELCFSQNLSFDIVPPAGINESEYASHLKNIDQPQRYGDNAFLNLTPGESEIRYAGKHFTAGIGYQSLWLGPGRFNSLILSNNAGGFPKIDLGFRDIRTSVGEFELFGWWGVLSESKYFDLNEGNDYNLFTGLHASYQPSFIPGFTIGFNRTLLADIVTASIDSYTSLYIPYMTTVFGKDKNDQRASISAEWEFPSVGFTAYTEWARNDYQPNLRFFIQFPQHTQAYTIGVEQKLFRSESINITGIIELTNLTISRDYTINDERTDVPSFYSHHIVNQGYTMDGQILGAGIGTGSNFQIAKIICETKKWRSFISLSRCAREQDYLYTFPYDDNNRSIAKSNTELSIELNATRFFTEQYNISFGIIHSSILNWNYIENNDRSNISLKISLSITN